MGDTVARSTFHILFPFSYWASEGGARLRALSIYHELRNTGAQVCLWTEHEPDRGLLAEYPVQRIQPFSGKMPVGGTLIVVGMAMLPGSWYEYAKPDRVLVECTMFAPQKLYRLVNRLSLGGRVNVEINYCSELVRRLCALPGKVHLSLSEMGGFFEIVRDQKPARQFTIGRFSRDTLEKHHFRDLALYQYLANAGCNVRIVGGTCLKPYLDMEIKGLELLPELPRNDLPAFTAQLDCFFYRTSAHCPEGWGLVVVEAMASGIPVVCAREGGYSQIIRQGENGFLFNADEEARNILLKLSRDRDMGVAVGKEASKCILGLINNKKALFEDKAIVNQ